MAIPLFTNHGLLPVGIHHCHLDEANEFFCWNDHRSQIWQRFMGFVDWIGTMPAPFTLYVDGSFVTDKAEPGDVDVAVDITGCSDVDQDRWFGEWARKRAELKTNFSTDFYPYMIGNGNDFGAFFQYVRISDALERGIQQGIGKGILRVSL